MIVTPLHRTKDAVRFFEQQQNSSWGLIGHPAAWSDDSAPPAPDPNTTAMTVPLCAIKATVNMMYEMAINETVNIGGTLTIGDQLQLTFTSSEITGSPLTVHYTTVSMDSTTLMATGLAAAINANGSLISAGVTAVSTGALVIITNLISTTVSFSKNVTGSATETMTLGTAVPAGSIEYTDALGNTRYFIAFPDVPSAIAGGCVIIMLTASTTGAQLASASITAFRQLGFATDLVPAGGHSSDTFLPSANVTTWGDLESITNRTPLTLDTTSNYTIRHLLDY